MSVFDCVVVRIPMPGLPPDVTAFCTYDMPDPYQNSVEVREDGSLWIREYCVEDWSDPDAVGDGRLLGRYTRVPRDWVPCTDFTGLLELHTFPDCAHTYHLYFEKGLLTHGPVHIR
jgi:hypothetical protein